MLLRAFGDKVVVYKADFCF